MRRFFSYLKDGLGIALIFVFILLFVRFLDRNGLREALTDWIASQENFAMFVFVIVGALLYSTAMPGNILGAIAYILFGFVDGFFLLSVAGILSAILTFIVVRAILFSPFQNWIHKRPKLYHLQMALQNKGAPFLCLVRFSPFNAAFINILFALSAIRFRDFMISLCSMIPQWLLYLYFGYSAAEAVDSQASAFSLPNLFRFATILIFIAIIVYVSRIVKHILNDSQKKISAAAGVDQI